MLGLALQETTFVIAWGALAGALFLQVTHLWIYTTFPAMLIAIHFLVSMELSNDAGPIVSLEMGQQTKEGKKVQSRTPIYFRILSTVVLFPAALIGYVPLLFGKPSIPESIAGIRLVSRDRRLDPRPISVIDDISNKAKIRMRVLTYIPLAAAAAAFILLHTAPEVMLIQQVEVADNALSQEEQELLTHYLQLITLHPEELEYHVRLASLYHRNNMQQDLMTELSVIRQIDPAHAILILADTTSFNFEMLETIPEDSAVTEVIPIQIAAVAEAPADSTESDSTSTDSTVVMADTTEFAGDIPAIDSLPADTVTTNLDSLPDALVEVEVDADAEAEADVDVDTLPETIPSAPAIETVAPAENEIQDAEEDTVEPDTIIQP